MSDPSSAPTEPDRPRTCSRTHLSVLFGRWGAFVSRNSLAVLLVPLVVAALLAVGLVAVEQESNPEDLWTPDGTEGQTTKADFDAHFGKFYRIQQIIVTRRDEAGGNVLEVDLLKELAAMQAAITNTTATRPGGRVVTLDDVCFRPIAEKTCVIATPLDYWGVNSGPFTSFEANLEANNCDPNSLRFRSFCGTPLGYSASEIAAKDALGAGLIQKNLLGGLTPDRARTAVDPTIPRILAAEAALVSWLLSWPSADRLDDALAWEAQFIERARALEEAQERAALEGASVREATTGVTVSGRLRLAYSSERSIEDEITRESSGDVKLVIISYVVVFVYTAIVLAGTHFSWARMGLGFIGVLLVVLALAAGLGLSAAIGLFFVPMTLQVIPFLIVGIGVDNIFVLVNAGVDFVPKEERDPERRMRLAFGKMGPAIFVNAATCASAFALGGITIMPGIRVFCFQVAICVVANILLQVTSLLALIAIVDRREVAEQAALAAAATAAAGSGSATASPPGAASPMSLLTPSPDSGASGPPPSAASFSSSSPSPPSPSSSSSSLAAAVSSVRSLVQKVDVAIETKLLPWMVSPWGMALLLGAWAAGLAGSIVGAHDLRMGLEVSDVIPSSSYLVPFNAQREQYFGGVGPPLYLVVGPANYTSWRTQDRLAAACAEIENSGWVSAPCVNWFRDFEIWVALLSPHQNDMVFEGDPSVDPRARLRIPPDRFYPWLNEYLATTCGRREDGEQEPCGESHKMNVVFDPTTGLLVRTRLTSQYVGLPNTDRFVDGMTEIRSLADRVGAANSISVDVYPYSVYYIYFEQYLLVTDEAVRNILVALADVFVVTTLFLNDPYMALLIVITIASVVAFMLGTMPTIGTKVNAISVVNLVVSVGLSVEFAAHPAMAFLRSKATQRRQRALDSSIGMGSSLISGGLSTILGVTVLAFAVYPLFVTYYFRMIILIIVFAMLHGLVFLPPLFALVGHDDACLARCFGRCFGRCGARAPSAEADGPGKEGRDAGAAMVATEVA